jgi:hypothetical protein
MDFAVLLLVTSAPAFANVTTDWDEKAVSTVQTGTLPPPPRAFRTIAILTAADSGRDGALNSRPPHQG